MAQDGSVATTFSLTNPYGQREGADPGLLDDELRGAGFSTDIRNFDQRAEAAFLLAGRLTGAVLSGEWFSTPHARYLGYRRRRL